MASAELNPSSGLPLYRQIKDILRREIADGTAGPETPMTEALLLKRFEVSLAPIRQALRELATEGYVYRKQGKGTFPVPGSRVHRPADVRLGALHDYLADRGLNPTSTVIGLEWTEPTDRLRSALNLDSGPGPLIDGSITADDRLLHITRLISVDGRPIARPEVHLRVPRGFDPTAAELEEHGSAFTLLERDHGLVLDHAEHDVWATEATAAQAETLAVAVGSPLLAIETLFFAAGGWPVGFRSAVHRADDFKYRFVERR
ncbi:GntR family transcriptional regulator [Citricoccus sp. K5]|uniref:GntR family transcriptional regulator n=1 Tax=Citricoccus sp. K5 TaxID=2653135 RepID=UPI0012F0ED03|nr:GntR family transcriptional regulator [Citricoccus sp. K5]VXB57326.1 Putative alkanesulfonate metabolism utilization regulator [Citricoccus sp. K5]